MLIWQLQPTAFQSHVNLTGTSCVVISWEKATQLSMLHKALAVHLMNLEQNVFSFQICSDVYFFQNFTALPCISHDSPFSSQSFNDSAVFKASELCLFLLYTCKHYSPESHAAGYLANAKVSSVWQPHNHISNLCSLWVQLYPKSLLISPEVSAEQGSVYSLLDILRHTAGVTKMCI